MTEVLHDQAFLPQPEPSPPPGRPWYRRAAVIIPVVVVTAAAAAVTTVLVVTSGSPDGAGATPQAPVVAPAQLRATVTSALTGAPLPVTLKLPDGTGVPVEANGSVATDRVRPGDQVGVIATGYVTAQVTVGADRTITASLQPTLATMTAQLSGWAEEKNADAITNWVFSPATGLQFTPSHSRSISGGLPWAAVRDVVGRTATVEAILFPGVVSNDSATEGLFKGEPAQVTIAGQPAWHGSTDDGYASEWKRGSLMITVYGPDLSTSDAVLAGMIAAQPVQ